MEVARAVRGCRRRSTDIAVEDTEGVCAINATEGKVVRLRPEATWKVSLSAVVPDQRSILFDALFKKDVTGVERRILRTKGDVSSCSGDMGTTSRNLRSRFAVSKARA